MKLTAKEAAELTALSIGKLKSKDIDMAYDEIRQAAEFGQKTVFIQISKIFNKETLEQELKYYGYEVNYLKDFYGEHIQTMTITWGR